jgi:hypothetical protein
MWSTFFCLYGQVVLVSLLFYHQCSSQATFNCNWGWTF